MLSVIVARSCVCVAVVDDFFLFFVPVFPCCTALEWSVCERWSGDVRRYDFSCVLSPWAPVVPPVSGLGRGCAFFGGRVVPCCTAPEWSAVNRREGPGAGLNEGVEGAVKWRRTIECGQEMVGKCGDGMVWNVREIA